MGWRRSIQNYPIFVLAFCIFRKQSYWQSTVPAIQKFKFKYFGHDMVILHEREIRKARSPFQFLVDPARRASFMTDLTAIVQSSEFTIVASAINKTQLQATYSSPTNPYDLALGFCLERLQYFLADQGEKDRQVHVVFECRGKREDKELEQEFQRVCQGSNMTNQGQLPFTPIFASKSANSCGLQLADLVARPIGNHLLNPEQQNRAFDVVRSKIRQSGGTIEGRGLKIFP